MTAGQRLELMIQFKEDTLDINTSIGFSGPDGYLTKRLYSQAYFTTNLVKRCVKTMIESKQQVKLLQWLAVALFFNLSI